MKQPVQGEMMATVPLAWCGWSTRVPPDWRPLLLEGGWDKGRMVVGTGEEAVFQVKWTRVRATRFDAAGWLADRVRRAVAPTAPTAPRGPGIDAAAWCPDVPSRGGGHRALWYGYAACAGLAMEWAVNLGAAPAPCKVALERILPAVTVAPPAEPALWALYDTRFRVPGGFRLERHHLFSGDIALRLTGGRARRLTVRQVYPAATALERRPLAAWLHASPFAEHRRYRPDGPAQTWTVDDPSGAPRAGLWQSGRKRLASPLHWAAPRWTLAGAVVDPRTDRLLLAEYDSATVPAPDALRAILADMEGGSGHDA